MAKKIFVSSVHAKLAEKKGRDIADHEIDYSDMPELTDEQLSQFKRIGRPLENLFPKKSIAIRLDRMVLEELKVIAEKKGKGYQTLIGEILADFVSKKSA